MAFEITYYHKETDPNSKIVAEFGIKVPKWELSFDKIKLIRSQHGKLFIAPPSFKTDETNAYGKPVYKPYWKFSPETQSRFIASLMPLIEDHIKTYFSDDMPPSALSGEDEDVPF